MHQTVLDGCLEETCLTPFTNCSLKLSKLNFYMTLFLPLFNIDLPPLMIFQMFQLQSSLLSHRQPHPSPTDSFGPPLLSAIIGTPKYIASQGTIPKCSFYGVQRTHQAFFSRYFLDSLLTEVQKWTYFSTFNSQASFFSSFKCQMFSVTFKSQPPAMTSFTSLQGFFSSACFCRREAQASIARLMFFLRSYRLSESKYLPFIYFSMVLVYSLETISSSNLDRSMDGQRTQTLTLNFARILKLVQKTSRVNRLFTQILCAKRRDISSIKSMKNLYILLKKPPFPAKSLSGQWQQKIVLCPKTLRRGRTMLTWSATTASQLSEPYIISQTTHRRERMQASPPLNRPKTVSGTSPKNEPCS